MRWRTVAVLGTLLAVSGLAALVAYCFLPASRTPRYRVVAIPMRASANEIGARLRRAGIIHSARAFVIIARLLGESKHLQSGDYRLSPHMSLAQIVYALSSGQSISRWVTLPEGYGVDQIAQTLADAGLCDRRRFRRIALVGGRSFRVAGRTAPRSLEGYLFPDTYKLRTRATERQIIETMLANFDLKVAKPLAPQFARAAAAGLSMPKIITLASLVEREAKRSEERPIIAGVLLNRMRAHMPLQCDATVQYALGEHKSRLGLRDLKVDSPYNTYKHVGLPPGPICNPGLASIKAALQPARTPYLYYVANGDGSHVFSTTFADHTRAKRLISARRPS